MRRAGVLLFCVIIAACGKQQKYRAEKLPPIDSLLPEKCRRVIDTYIVKNKQREAPWRAVASFRDLNKRYPYTKDSLTHATIEVYSAQVWDVLKESDSMIECCEDALLYLDRHPEYLDLRFMCHFYTGWAYNYKKQLLAANYFFSMAGNELLDTIYVPGYKQSVTNHFPPATKAALLEEIAAHARYSELQQQAEKYINAALQQTQLAKDTISVPSAVIMLEAGMIYTQGGAYETALSFFKKAQAVDSMLKDEFLHRSLLDNIGDYYLKTRHYDAVLRTYAELDSLNNQDSTTDVSSRTGTWLSLAEANIETGNYEAAERYLSLAGPIIRADTATDNTNLANLLQDQLLLLLAKHDGREGKELMNEYIDLRSKILERQRAGAIVEMDARYSLHRKEDNISHLSLANKEYSERVKAQNRLLTISVLSILLVVSGGIIIWQRSRQQRLIEDRDKKDLQQRLLRSQMEPHFIFNTLSVLQGLIRSDEKDRSIKYLNRFARLLRISLEHARKGLVPVKEEVEALDHYLSLQQVRFTGVFKYEIKLWDGYEEEGQGLLIPPMLLQPFAENAVQHGMAGLKDEEGVINITIEKVEGVLNCIIRDNGRGIGLTPENSGKGTSLSTVITRERLDILSRETGKPASVTREHTDRGTIVRIVIPYKEQN